MTITAIIAFQVLAIVAVLAFLYLGHRRTVRAMRATFQGEAFSPAWTGSNGKRYRMNLASGQIIAA